MLLLTRTNPNLISCFSLSLVVEGTPRLRFHASTWFRCLWPPLPVPVRGHFSILFSPPLLISLKYYCSVSFVESGSLRLICGVSCCVCPPLPVPARRRFSMSVLPALSNSFLRVFLCFSCLGWRFGATALDYIAVLLGSRFQRVGSPPLPLPRVFTDVLLHPALDYRNPGRGT